MGARLARATVEPRRTVGAVAPHWPAPYAADHCALGGGARWYRAAGGAGRSGTHAASGPAADLCRRLPVSCPKFKCGRRSRTPSRAERCGPTSSSKATPSRPSPRATTWIMWPVLWTNELERGSNDPPRGHTPHSAGAGRGTHGEGAGDTLESIAKKFDVDPAVIVEFPGNKLQPGADARSRERICSCRAAGCPSRSLLPGLRAGGCGGRRGAG